jgi:hypothetical protein
MGESKVPIDRNGVAHYRVQRTICFFLPPVVVLVMCLLTSCGSDECQAVGCSSAAVVYIESQTWRDGSYSASLEFDGRTVTCSFTVSGTPASGDCDDRTSFLILDTFPSSVRIRIPHTPERISVEVSRDGVEIGRMSDTVQYEDVTPAGSCSTGCLAGAMHVSVAAETP